MQIGLGISLTGSGRVAPLNPASLLTGNNGFYFDFGTGATGTTIASVTSAPPSTVQATQGTAGARPVWTDAATDYALFDGIDDFLLSTLTPAAVSNTLAACFRVTSIDKSIIGSRGGVPDTRCFLTTDGTGKLGGGWATQNQTTIFGGSDIRGTDVVGLMRVNGSVVELWQNGTRIYQAAPGTMADVGAALAVGANNVNGVAAAFADARIYRAFASQTFVSDANLVPLMRALGAGVVAF